MSAVITLSGPSTTLGAPLITPAALDAAVNAALATNAATAAAATAQSTMPGPLNAAFLAWMAQLPTTRPSGPGQAWNNGGVPSVS